MRFQGARRPAAVASPRVPAFETGPAASTTTRRTPCLEYGWKCTSRGAAPSTEHPRAATVSSSICLTGFATDKRLEARTIIGYGWGRDGPMM